MAAILAFAFAKSAQSTIKNLISFVSTNPQYVPANQKLVWADEFGGTSINPNNWAFEIGNGNWGWGNNELEYYTSSSTNAYIQNGSLVIQAVNQPMGGKNYTSARMKT